MGGYSFPQVAITKTQRAPREAISPMSDHDQASRDGGGDH